MKMHSEEECKVKLKGIKMLGEQLMRRNKDDNIDDFALSESITIMCEELLREFPDDKEN